MDPVWASRLVLIHGVKVQPCSPKDGLALGPQCSSFPVNLKKNMLKGNEERRTLALFKMHSRLYTFHFYRILKD